MELQILHAIQEIHQEWLTDDPASFTTIGESGLVWIVIAIVLTCIPKTRKCGLTMIIAMAITYLVGNLFLKNVIARPRPCAVDPGVTLKIPFPSEYSFPSGHSFQRFCRSGDHFQLLS
ncbi:MAG: phosphatase PAP2 family protein [Waltera sp.]